MRRDFVANVSHELKTPVTSIQGFVETLREGAVRDPAKSERFLEIVARQSDRLNAIIEDLLSLSRIEREGEAGRVERVRTDLGPVLKDAVADCASKASSRKVEVRLDWPGPRWVMGNARLLRQALGNLLDNAIKYSESGGVVAVGVANDEEWVRVEVTDHGPGIAPDQLPRIFERFYRVDKGRSRELGGTGLGLAIVKHIAQVHGGRVTVESEPGRGSRFTLHLPSA